MTLRRDLIAYFTDRFNGDAAPILSSAEIGSYPVGRDSAGVNPEFSLGLVVPAGVPEVVYGGHILYYEHSVTIYFVIPENPNIASMKDASPTQKQDMAQRKLMEILMELVGVSGPLPGLPDLPDSDPYPRVSILSVSVDTDDVDAEEVIGPNTHTYNLTVRTV